MNLHEFERTLKLTFLLPFILLVLLAAALGWQIRTALAYQQAVDRSDRVTAELNQLQKLVIDEETGLRGFELTRDPVMLAPYLQASGPLWRCFVSLQSMLRDDPGQMAALGRVRAAHDRWLKFADQALSQARAGSPAPEGFDRSGKDMMDALRAEVAGMTDAEEARRSQAQSAAARRVRVLMLSLSIACSAIGLLLGLLAIRNMRRISAAFYSALDEAHQRAAELHESREWLQTTLASIGDALIACSPRGTIEFMNPVAEELTGWTLAEAQGASLSTVLPLIHQHTRQAVDDPVAKVLATNAAVELANHTILLARGGREYIIDDSAAPIRNDNGEIAGVVMVFRDVTENRRKEAALLASEKLAVAGRLAATIAHELHNPLDAVANLLYLIEHSTNAEDTERYLKMAQQELDRTTQISRTMLSLHRDPKESVAVDLNELVQSVVALLERKLRTESVSITCSVPAGARVQGFPGELRQVLTNLIANAADAAGRGGRIEVVAAPSRPEDGPAGFVISIADSGPGIDEEVRDRLFQPFFTTKGESGTGLGLWVSRGIVLKHGGTLDLSNANHGDGLRGALARVYLPASTAMRANIA